MIPAGVLLYRDDTGRTQAEKLAQRVRVFREPPGARHVPRDVRHRERRATSSLYGGGFALMQVTRSATSVACPWPYPEAKVYDPQGFYEEDGQPGPYFPGIWSGWQSGQPDGRPDVDPPAGRRPLRTAAMAEPRSVVDHRRVARPRAGHRRPPPPRGMDGGRRRAVARRRARAPARAHRRAAGRSAPRRRPPRPRRPRVDRGCGRARSSTRSGAPDGVVHNAGIAGVGCLEELPDARPGSRSSRPTSSARSGSREALLPAMRAAGRGRIVMVSSMGAVRGMPGIGAYSATQGSARALGRVAVARRSPRSASASPSSSPGRFKTDILELTQTYADPDGPYAALHARPRDRRAAGSSASPQPPERFAPAVERALDERAPVRAATASASTPACCWSATASPDRGCSSASPPEPSASLGPVRFAAIREQTATVTAALRRRAKPVADSPAVEFEPRMLDRRQARRRRGRHLHEHQPGHRGGPRRGRRRVDRRHAPGHRRRRGGPSTRPTGRPTGRSASSACSSCRKRSRPSRRRCARS